MYKVEVIADESGTWCGNAQTYETQELAEEAARDLFARWMLVKAWRVVRCDEEQGPGADTVVKEVSW